MAAMSSATGHRPRNTGDTPAAAGSADAEPIDKQTRSVSGKNVPLLDASWITELRCLAYEPPPPPLASQTAEDAWQERCQYLAEDLEALLAMPHWQFWCHVLHDRSVVGVMLDSYLRLAPRWHDRSDWRGFSDPVLGSLRRLHRLVFFACLRLSTHRETPENCISESGFSDLHSRIRLFTAPRLMDLCALYSRGNQQLVGKMVGSLLRRLPWLAGELHSAAVTLGGRVLLDSAKGSDRAGGCYCPDRLAFARDALETLAALVDAAAGFPDVSDGLEAVLPPLYESVVPAAQNALAGLASSGAADLDEQMRSAYRLHSICLRLYHRLWSDSLVTGEKRAHSILVGLSQSVHSCRQFLAAAEAAFGLTEELEAAESVDPELTEYIVKAVASAVAEFGARRASPSTPVNGGAAAAAAVLEGDEDGDDEDDEGGGRRRRQLAGGIVNSAFMADDGDAEAGTATAQPDEVQLESLVSHVLDIFPSIGSGFVKVCLWHYAYDTEKLINALLEDSLPPKLNSLDRAMLSAPAAAAAPLPPAAAAAAGAVNDFGFRQPDALNREALRGRLHRGKRDAPSRDNQPDNEEERKLRVWLVDWQERLHVAEEAEAEAEVIAEGQKALAAADRAAAGGYEDEYDDTYDAAAVAADRAAGGDSSSQEESGAEDSPQQQQQPGQPPVFDVRGTGRRGRGQTHRVVLNRSVKERDKGFRANHNRRALSDRKRAGGMLF